MKNYIINNNQLKRIIEQIDDEVETKKPEVKFPKIPGFKSDDTVNQDDNLGLDSSDPIQQFFDSLV